jgi:hypothetical protein
MTGDVRKWRACTVHPDRQIAPFHVVCLACEVEMYSAAAARARAARIDEAVEIFTRCLPLFVAAFVAALKEDDSRPG